MTRRRDESGAVAIIIAISLTAILVVVALVLDFGLVRVDRQVDKSAADSATLAGLHALNAGDANTRPFVGVCAAINYLQQNNERFSGISPSAGTWTNGADTPLGVTNPCSDTTYQAKVCTPGDNTSWAKFVWTGSMDSKPLNVVIQSGYLLTSTGYSEDALPAAAADTGDSSQQGCDQLAVLINQQRAPGLGSLATSSDLKTSIRSVGRVKQEAGGYAPAMLLLEQKTCPVLESGSNSGVSFIHVLGAESSDGTTQPGSIHSDSDASTSCSGGSNQNIFLGKGNDGVVAYAAPVAGNPTSADASKPGQLTSYAGLLGKALNYIIDNNGSLSSAYAATGVSAAAPGTHSKPTGLPRVTRAPVDDRYFTGVKGAISTANNLFTALTGPVAATAAGYSVLSGCSATQADVNALNLTATSWLYVDCNGAFQGPNGALTINAQRIVFRGSVAPQKAHTYPNATQVYVNGTAGGNAVDVGNNAALKIHTSGRLDGSGRCSTSRSTDKAILMVRNGRLRESNGGQIQFCNTTVIMMSGRADGCVPAAKGTVPTSTPCSGVNSGLGDGHLLQQGGDVDWTAPDAIDITIGSDGKSTAAALAGWADSNGPEDLAYWSESASGGTANDIFRLQGGGVFNLRGVFMAPNATPFTIGGGATLTLTNAQFIARTIALNGTNTNITMRVDGNAAVRLPKITLVGLVR